MRPVPRKPSSTSFAPTADALHVATFVLARRRLGTLELLTADARMRDAVSGT